MAEWNRNTPWRQGQLLTQEAIDSLALLNKKTLDRTLVIVASHDCDLTQDLSSEPNIEVIIGVSIDELDGNCTNGKSSRTIHIQFNGNPLTKGEFVATDKTVISKELLSSFSPRADIFLSPESKATFQRWLSARYRRSAFPDQFESRLIRETKIAEKISKAVKRCGESITAILFDVDEGEEVVRTDETDVYILDIYLLHNDIPDYDTADEVAKKLKALIEKIFKDKLFNKDDKSWKLIELRYVDVISEHTLTYERYKMLKWWRFDHISLGADPQQETLD